MKENNIVIGIEGLVGSGKTSICKNLLNKIPNSVLLHGGNIYRAIVYAIMNSGKNLEEMKKNLKRADVKSIMDELKINVKIENNESVMYIEDRPIKDEELQSDRSSLAVSTISSIADNSKLYEFGKKLIGDLKLKYNVILSSRDIMRMYPETDYHFFITASLEKRIERKCIQYKNEISKEKIQENINKRDELQKKSGYYDKHEKTVVIDVTKCTSIEESTEKLLNYIKVPIIK